MHFIQGMEKSIIFDDENRIFQSKKTIRNSDRAYYEEFGEFVVDILLMESRRGLSVSSNIANQLYSSRRSYLARLGETVVGAECVRSVEAALRALDAFAPSFALDYIEIVRTEMGQWQYA